MVVGCKDDLRSTEHPSRLLPEHTIGSWTESMQLTYTECSAKNGDVETVLRIVGMIVLSNERREHHRTPAQLYGNKVSLVSGLTEMSVAKGLRFVCQAYSNRLALGERLYDSDGQKLLRYKWTTYKELGERIKNFGSGLKTLVPSRSFVCLCAENSVSWIVADMAMQVQNMVSVMVHYTLPDEDIDYIVSHSELDAVITTPSLVKSFARAASVNPKLKAVIVQQAEHGKNHEISPSLLEECRSVAPNTQFLLMSQVEDIGAPLPDEYIESTDSNEVFTISYTSGSTGRPKGIMMSSGSHRRDVLHDNMAPSIGVVFEPLSHSERLNTYAKLCGGGRVSFFNGEMDTLLEELQVCGPTLFISVPRFWNVLYGEFNKIVALYRKHMPDKGPRAAEGLARQLFESLMGGRITYAATGGAPTSPAILQWMHSFGFIVSESYGSMEVGGITSSKRFSPDLEFRLVDVPEMGYTSKDKPYPRGELCIKSNTMFSGYHNNPQETSEAFIEGGFFRTGDIVQLEGPESVKIIDRKKFIFKLAQGEYVSPAKSEAVYDKSKFIGQMMAYGNSLQSYLVALVVPNQAILASWASSHGIKASFEQLCKLPEIKILLLTEMRNCEISTQLRPYEKVRDIFVTSERFTPDNGLLTATSKLNRRAILNKYRSQLDALYESPTSLEKADLSASQELAGDSEALHQLKQLVAQALPSSSSDLKIENDMHLATSGLDSMAALKLVKTISETMKVSVPISSLYQPGMTVQSLAQAVSHQQGTVEHLRDASTSVMEEEVSPDVDIDPYNWFPELLPPYKSANEKKLEIIAKQDAQKARKVDVQKELMARLNKGCSTSDYKKATMDVDSPASSSSIASSSSSSNTTAARSAKPPASSKLTSATGTHLFEQISYNNILLTGATGFLGLYLMKDILATFPSANIHCIVRAQDDQAAIAKLEKAIAFAHMETECPDLGVGGKSWSRIKVINADLSKKRFGLSDETWNQLADSIDSVYHCATWVNTLFPYQVLRPANVESTVQLIKLCLTGKKPRKAFHYISTLSAISKSVGWTPEFSIATTAKLFGFHGYPLTKRVCEMLIANVEELLPDWPVVIYRPGSIVGHRKTGHINIEAFIHKLICGMVQFGSYPISKKWSFDMDWVPVDFASRSIVHISQSGGTMRSPRRYNICNPYSRYSMSINRLAQFIKEYGYNLEPMTFRLWRKNLASTFDSAPNTNALEPLRGYFDDGFPSDPRFECSSTLSSLKPMKKLDETSKSMVIDTDATPIDRCHPISKEHLHAILDFCVEKGYLKPPQATRTRSASTCK
jgi:thioester reductase-like protein